MFKLLTPSQPRMPTSPMQYEQRYGDELTSILRLYFTQLENTISTIIGNEGGHYLSFPYGSFLDTTTQTAAAINTGYPVKFNTTDVTNSVKVTLDGSSNPTKLVVDESGIYNFVFSLQLYNSGGSAGDVYIWIKVNNVNVPNSMGRVTVPAGQYAIQSWNFFPSLAAGDYLQIMWSTSDTNIKLQAITAPAFAPASPSATMTANFISLPPTNSSA